MMYRSGYERRLYGVDPDGMNVTLMNRALIELGCSVCGPSWCRHLKLKIHVT
jgi:hypothetical protein